MDLQWSLARPVNVALGHGRVYIVDTAFGVLVTCNRDGSAASRLPFPEGFSPIAVAATETGVLVADRTGGAVHAFGPDGSRRGEIIAGGVVRRCGGLAVCADGDILLTDAEAGQLVRLSSEGIEKARTGQVGSEDGAFNLPTAVVEAGDGTIWVLDTFNFRVQHLSGDLLSIGGFGEHGDGSGQFALPKGLAVDPGGHLYVSDARFDVIQVFDAMGRLLLVIGRHGAGEGEFWNPAGLASDADGNLAVADTANSRVQLLRYRRRGGT
jgi:DNA-binding beta-propeller fold protein YncE